MPENTTQEQDALKQADEGLVAPALATRVLPGMRVPIKVLPGHTLTLTADGNPQGCNYTISLFPGTPQHLGPRGTWRRNPSGGTVNVTIVNEGPGTLTATV